LSPTLTPTTVIGAPTFLPTQSPSFGAGIPTAFPSFKANPPYLSLLGGGGAYSFSQDSTYFVEGAYLNMTQGVVNIYNRTSPSMSYALCQQLFPPNVKASILTRFGVATAISNNVVAVASFFSNSTVAKANVYIYSKKGSSFQMSSTLGQPIDGIAGATLTLALGNKFLFLGVSYSTASFGSVRAYPFSSVPGVLTGATPQILSPVVSTFDFGNGIAIDSLTTTGTLFIQSALANNGQGGVYVYAYTALGNSYSLQQILTGTSSSSSSTNTGYGRSGLSISRNVLAVGVGSLVNPPTSGGSVLIYTYVNVATMFSLQQTLKAPSGSFDFGSAVKISGGNKIAVGVSSLNMAYVYTGASSSSATSFSLQQTLIPQMSGVTNFGTAVTFVASTACIASSSGVFFFLSPSGPTQFPTQFPSTKPTLRPTFAKGAPTPPPTYGTLASEILTLVPSAGPYVFAQYGPYWFEAATKDMGNIGSVSVYVRGVSNTSANIVGNYSLLQKLSMPGVTTFGCAIAANQNILTVGVVKTTTVAQIAVYTIATKSNTFSLYQTLSINANTGFALSLASNGVVIAAGVYYSVSSTGFAIVFIKQSTGLFAQTQILTAPIAAGLSLYDFGNSILISGTNSILVQSGYAYTKQGGVFAYAQISPNGTYALSQAIFESIAASTGYGASGLSFSNGILAVGSPKQSLSVGAIYVYSSSSLGIFTQQQVLSPPSTSGATGFGLTMQFSQGILAVGVPTALKSAGAAFTYVLGSTTGSNLLTYSQTLSAISVTGLGQSITIFDGSIVITSLTKAYLFIGPPMPTTAPTRAPTPMPSNSPKPSPRPTFPPSPMPSFTPVPTNIRPPTLFPTARPSARPTLSALRPTAVPSYSLNAGTYQSLPLLSGGAYAFAESGGTFIEGSYLGRSSSSASVAQGVVYVYNRGLNSPFTYTLTQTITAPLSYQIKFGVAVGFRQNTLAIGSATTSSAGQAPYLTIYQMAPSSGVFTLNTFLTISGAATGYSLAISVGTNVIAVGVSYISTTPGFVNIYTVSAVTGRYILFQTLTSPSSSFFDYGNGVVAATSGQIIIQTSYAFASTGGVYVFNQPSATGLFSLQQVLQSTLTQAAFGDSGLWYDNNILLVGSAKMGLATGGIYVFVSGASGSAFTQLQLLLAPTGLGCTNFGALGATVISGGKIIAGVASANSGQGAAFVYVPSSSSSVVGFTLQQTLQLPTGIDTQIGTAVTLVQGTAVLMSLTNAYLFIGPGAPTFAPSTPPSPAPTTARPTTAKPSFAPSRGPTPPPGAPTLVPTVLPSTARPTPLPGQPTLIPTPYRPTPLPSPVPTLPVAYCKPFFASNSSNALYNYQTCYINACPGKTLVLGDCYANQAASSDCYGDQYLRLFDMNNNQVAYNNDFCGKCSQITYVVPPSQPSCYLYALHMGCTSSGSCGGLISVTGGTTAAGANPTPQPSPNPTVMPTSMKPTAIPSPNPSIAPSPAPSTRPPTPAAGLPTQLPTTAPPTALPTRSPSPRPSLLPSPSPSVQPTPRPSFVPSPSPSQSPSPQPTPNPSPRPSALPSRAPTAVPTAVPTAQPTLYGDVYSSFSITQVVSGVPLSVWNLNPGASFGAFAAAVYDSLSFDGGVTSVSVVINGPASTTLPQGYVPTMRFLDEQNQKHHVELKRGIDSLLATSPSPLPSALPTRAPTPLPTVNPLLAVSYTIKFLPKQMGLTPESAEVLLKQQITSAVSTSPFVFTTNLQAEANYKCPAIRAATSKWMQVTMENIISLSPTPAPSSMPTLQPTPSPTMAPSSVANAVTGAVNNSAALTTDLIAAVVVCSIAGLVCGCLLLYFFRRPGLSKQSPYERWGKWARGEEYHEQNFSSQSLRAGTAGESSRYSTRLSEQGVSLNDLYERGSNAENNDYAHQARASPSFPHSSAWQAPPVPSPMQQHQQASTNESSTSNRRVSSMMLSSQIARPAHASTILSQSRRASTTQDAMFFNNAVKNTSSIRLPPQASVASTTTAEQNQDSRPVSVSSPTRRPPPPLPRPNYEL